LSDLSLKSYKAKDGGAPRSSKVHQNFGAKKIGQRWRSEHRA
jgi:hypothetical protein